jgi:gas vesicle protein
LHKKVTGESYIATTMRSVRTTTRNVLVVVLMMTVVMTALQPAPVLGNKPPSNFRVVLDSPRGNDKKTRVMLKNKLSDVTLFHSESVQQLVDRAKKDFHDISSKTKKVLSQVENETRELVDKFKDNLQHYSKLELGFYAALTVALTVTLKSK